MICQACGVEATTKYVSFYQNIGMLVMRTSGSPMSGNLCKSCIHSYFWKLTATTFFLGWWGVHSFIITPFLLLNNIIRYVFCLGMEPVPRGARPPELSASDFEKLQPYTEEIFDRLGKNETFPEVAADIARLTGMTCGQVAIYVRSVIQSTPAAGEK